MAFEGLSEKLQGAFRKLTGETPASYRKHQEYIPISLQGDEE